MHRRTGPLTLALVVALTLVVTGLIVGCSTDSPEPRWEEVTSGSFSGDGDERLDLGLLSLTGEVRLAWDLSGPSDARVRFELEATRSVDTDAPQSVVGEVEGVSTDVNSQDEWFSPQTDAGLTLELEPDDCHVAIGQRMLGGTAVGYAGTFTLYTQVLD